MSQNAKKEQQLILKQMRRRGFKVEQARRGGHWSITDPESGRTITVSATPSDPRAPEYVRSDIKKHLGVNLRRPATKRRGAADDWALQRLRERTLKQMERGASNADLARMAVVANEGKNIGGWSNPNSASVGIISLLKGGRLMKPNHDTLAAALSKLESAAEPHIFERHLDDAAERLGQRRVRPQKPEAPVAVEPKEPEEHAVESPSVRDEPEQPVDPPTPGSAPQGTITIRLEIDRETRDWLSSLLAGVQVLA